MLKNDKESEVIFLEDELFILSRIFLQIPWEYGFSGPVGKKYEAIKDFLNWHNYEVEKWTPIILRMANSWINESSKKSQ